MNRSHINKPMIATAAVFAAVSMLPWEAQATNVISNMQQYSLAENSLDIFQNEEPSETFA